MSHWKQYLKSLKVLSDEALHESLLTVTHNEKNEMVKGIAHLVEVVRRRMDLGQAEPSVWSYAKKTLGFSLGEAQRRVPAAFLAYEIPETLDDLESGKLTLCSAQAAWNAFQAQKRKIKKENKAPNMFSEVTQSKPFNLEQKREILSEIHGKSVHETHATLNEKVYSEHRAPKKPYGKKMGYNSLFNELRIYYQSKKR